MNLRYEEEKEKCREFLSESEHVRDGFTVNELLQRIANRELKVLTIYLDDVLDFKGDEEFVGNIQRNAMRYVKFFREAAMRVMPIPTVMIEDTYDVSAILSLHRGQEQVPDDVREILSELERKFEVRIHPPSKLKDVPIPIRQIKANLIGSLITLRGIVTRVSEIRPYLSVATYVCDQCGYEVYQTVTSSSFKPLSTCETEKCRANQLRGNLTLQTRGCKFVKFQQLRLQELPDQVPIGHIPRQITVHLTGELTRQVAPGDIINVSGVFIPSPSAKHNFLYRTTGISTETYVEASAISVVKKSYTDLEISPDDMSQISELSERSDIYQLLARSIAPEIYGMIEVKKALLLLLIGGVTRTMKDGMRIRGDINICLMGDPGIAKSQLLKHIAHVSPRGVYTSGKGSSGVGLTAAVLKDPVTGEFVLEGGALVLADMGVCCIDEFDKMDERDRTYIHEVMEQQTISIAKAGIMTTLNARTSILAAANPLFGRYNLRRSPHQNINMPFALLSRFDLLFILLDRPRKERDIALAQHVASVHKNEALPQPAGGGKKGSDSEFVSPSLLRAYVAVARKVEPVLTEEVSDYLSELYMDMRKPQVKQKGVAAKLDLHLHVGARTLLAVLRLSQALARLRMKEVITEREVNEAKRLLESTYADLIEEMEGDRAEERTAKDVTSAIYELVSDYARNKRTSVLSMSEIERVVLAAGYRRRFIEQCIDEYEQLNVWQTNADHTQLRIIG